MVLPGKKTTEGITKTPVTESLDINPSRKFSQDSESLGQCSATAGRPMNDGPESSVSDHNILDLSKEWALLFSITNRLGRTPVGVLIS